MITKVFSIFDAKAAVYGPPFFAPREAIAIRSFTDLANDRSTTISRHPEDFDLRLIGEFNDETGELINVENKILGTAAMFVRVDLPITRVNGSVPVEVHS